MSDEISQSPLSRVPHWVRLKITELGISCPEIWIHQKIPALSNQAVVETLKHPDGEARLHEYFARIGGRF